MDFACKTVNIFFNLPNRKRTFRDNSLKEPGLAVQTPGQTKMLTASVPCTGWMYPDISLTALQLCPHND